MPEIEFSVMEVHDGDTNHLLPLLQIFEQQHHIHVNLTAIPWVHGWEAMTRYSFYGHGPDVSSIGTSWVSSLAGMNTLRAFTPQEVQVLGGAESFFDASWQSGFLLNDPTCWAIPWLADVHVLYFHKDAFEKAGIADPCAVLASQDALMETLVTLQKSDIPYPLALTTTKSALSLQEAAHWVWRAGGDFISPDRREAIFHHPAALEGFRNYFRLQPFISPESFSFPEVVEQFDREEAVINLSGPYKGTIGRRTHPGWEKSLGICGAPGPTFLGGCSLAIWQYSHKASEAFELVRFLSSQPASIPVLSHDYLLPTRRQALEMPLAKSDVFQRTFLQAVQAGRSFPTMRLWGLLEEKLVNEIAAIWAELFAAPSQDLDACLHKHLDPLAERLDIVLQN